MASTAQRTAPTGLETWRNATQGLVVLRRLDHRGDFTKTEIVEGGRTFHITPEERRMNQELAASPAQDSFATGALTPVHLLDDEHDAREIAANPNLMSETEMRTLVKGHQKTLVAKMQEVTNPVTLQRLLAIAQDEPDVAYKKVQAIQAHIAGVNPSLYTEVTSAQAAQAEPTRVVDGLSRREDRRPASFDPAGRQPRGVSPR